MALGLVASGKAIAQSADELARIWRLARTPARPDVFPGLLDGIMQAFFARSGQLMSAGRPPEEVWHGLSGLVRWSPALGAKELTQEWAVAMEVLTAACESLSAEPDVAQWLARAVARAEKGTAALRDEKPSDDPPTGIVTGLVFGDLRPRRRRDMEDEGEGEQDA
jgi:hypothetical protein